MAYVKIDDNFFRHPKAIRAGRDGRILFIAGVCYCGNSLTDGFIPGGALVVLGAESGIAKPNAVANILVEVGLWKTTAGGFIVHDYLEYNTSSEKVHAERSAARERMKRNRSSDVRPNISRTSPEVRQPETETETSCSNEQEREGDETSPLAQIPDSDPTKIVSIAEKPKPQKRPHRLPDDFTPSDELKTWAKNEQGLTDHQIAAETEKFRNHFIGTGKPHVDWAATWRNWMIRIGEFAPSRASPNGNKPKAPPLIEHSQPQELTGFRAMSAAQRAARRQEGA